MKLIFRCALFAWPTPLPLITVMQAKLDSTYAAAFHNRSCARKKKADNAAADMAAATGISPNIGR
jgi:hypothetical protein